MLTARDPLLPLIAVSVAAISGIFAFATAAFFEGCLLEVVGIGDLPGFADRIGFGIGDDLYKTVVLYRVDGMRP